MGINCQMFEVLKRLGFFKVSLFLLLLASNIEALCDVKANLIYHSGR